MPQQDLHGRVKETSSWLQRHYFDFMAGISTGGGLVNIILRRLEMSIDGCIAHFEKLGASVFVHSRWYYLASPLWLPKDKHNHHDHKISEQVIQEVFAKKAPNTGAFPEDKYSPSMRTSVECESIRF